jgi:hypothetical protein
MRYQIEPMARWPYPETQGRKGNPFRAKFGQTLELLEDELDHLQVTGAVAVRVVAAEADVRRDGMLRSRADVRHPGVVLSFHSAKAGQLTYPCDRFYGAYRGEIDWQINLRAIALGLEALRRLDRYGITSRGEQYTGWRAIESGSSEGFADVNQALTWLVRLLADQGQDAPTEWRALLRKAAGVAHPDRHNGDRTLWGRYDAARQLLEREEAGRG